MDKEVKVVEDLLSAVVLVVGLYMLFVYAGKALPPTLSGIAFALIGLKGLMLRD